MSIARTILEQLGGNRFLVMTGAECSADSRALVIKLPRSLVVVVELTPADVYTVKVGKRATMKQIFSGKPAVKWLKTYEDVYCDQLREIFTAGTGLHCTL